MDRNRRCGENQIRPNRRSSTIHGEEQAKPMRCAVESLRKRIRSGRSRPVLPPIDCPDLPYDEKGSLCGLFSGQTNAMIPGHERHRHAQKPPHPAGLDLA